MKKITTILILILSLGVYSQDNINIAYNEDLQAYEVTAKQGINKIQFARVKDKEYTHLKTIEPRKGTYVIPNRYFKYKCIRVTITSGYDLMVQDFITKNKRR